MGAVLERTITLGQAQPLVKYASEKNGDTYRGYMSPVPGPFLLNGNFAIMRGGRTRG